MSALGSSLSSDGAAVLADAWLHDLDPFIVRLSGDFGLRWYGLSYSAGFVLGWVALRFLIARGAVLIAKERAIDVIFAAALAAVVGGRLGYCLFYQPSLLWTFDGGLPFWSVLKLNEGGMASHGGMIGVAIAAWIISRGVPSEDGERLNRVPYAHVLDTLALIAPFGLFLGRLANFVNGELLGSIVARPGEAAPWWSVRYPQEVLTGHAPELSAEQSEAMIVLIDDYRVDAYEEPEIAYERVLDALRRGSEEVAARLEPLISARHPSQLYQALAEGLVLGVVLWVVAAKPRRPGVLLATTLVVYGMGRIATELFRLPDDHLAVQRFLGLSRGQLLSGVMIAVGVAILAWTWVRGGEAIGGWWRKTEAPDAGSAA
ncbi:MAG: prolipoprotein diacylglyceryl transferase [Planctomycetota bacterium]